nr:MAG TPA: hypothetical protein [Caudoviricetes sp.]
MRRFVDVYKRTPSGGLTPVATGLQQIGLPSVQCVPAAKLYTMADGTLCAYPSAAQEKMTIDLECTQNKAQALQKAAVTYGSLVFAGVHRCTGAPAQAIATLGKELYITEACTLSMISYKADLCKLSIPVVGNFTGDMDLTPVPAVKLSPDYVFVHSGRFRLGDATYDGTAYTYPQLLSVPYSQSVIRIACTPTINKVFGTSLDCQLSRYINAQWGDAVPDGESDSWITVTAGTSFSKNYTLPADSGVIRYRLRIRYNGINSKWMVIYFNVYRERSETQ